MAKKSEEQRSARENPAEIAMTPVMESEIAPEPAPPKPAPAPAKPGPRAGTSYRERFRHAKERLRRKL